MKLNEELIKSKLLALKTRSSNSLVKSNGNSSDHTSKTLNTNSIKSVTALNQSFVFSVSDEDDEYNTHSEDDESEGEMNNLIQSSRNSSISSGSGGGGGAGDHRYMPARKRRLIHHDADTTARPSSSSSSSSSNKKMITIHGSAVNKRKQTSSTLSPPPLTSTSNKVTKTNNPLNKNSIHLVHVSGKKVGFGGKSSRTPPPPPPVSDGRLEKMNADIQRMKDMIAKKESAERATPPLLPPTSASPPPGLDADQHSIKTTSSISSSSTPAVTSLSTPSAITLSEVKQNQAEPIKNTLVGADPVVNDKPLSQSVMKGSKQPAAQQSTSAPSVSSQTSASCFSLSSNESTNEKQRLECLAQRQATLRFKMQASLEWRAVESQAQKVNQSRIQIQHAEGVLEKMRGQVAELSSDNLKLRSDYERLVVMSMNARSERLKAINKLMEERKKNSTSARSSNSSSSHSSSSSSS